MDLSPTAIWFAVGLAFLLFEAVGIPGAGLLFAGLGAFTVGTLLNLELIASDATTMQFIVFLLATALWTLILWKPMRRFYSTRNEGGYKNMVGDTAYIGTGGLIKGHAGEATWSGTIMKAKLAESSGVDKVEPGSQVEIVDVSGATLIVKPKL
jgi:membrane protein implicated in regulation of membrane protease activity